MFVRMDTFWIVTARIVHVRCIIARDGTQRLIAFTPKHADTRTEPPPEQGKCEYI